VNPPRALAAKRRLYAGRLLQPMNVSCNVTSLDAGELHCTAIFESGDRKMKTRSTRKAAFDGAGAELISIIPWAYRSTAKPYVADEIFARILDATLDAMQGVWPT
jgi:hypothetical protein